MSGFDETRLGEGLPCLVFTPRAEAEGPRPLIVFLHGVGERGDSVGTLDRLLVHSLPWRASAGSLPAVRGGPFPYIVACPQTAGGWEEESGRVGHLIDRLAERHGADRGRVHVTGISLGSVGAWQIAAAVPGIAAIAPVSWDLPDLAAAVDVPAWIEVGAQDPFVDSDRVSRGVEALGRGDRVVLRVDPDGGHNGGYWNHVYGDAALYEWLLGWPRG